MLISAVIETSQLVFIRKIDRHKRKARIAVEMFGRNIDMEIGLEIIAKITQGQSDPIENDINNLRIE